MSGLEYKEDSDAGQNQNSTDFYSENRWAFKTERQKNRLSKPNLTALSEGQNKIIKQIKITPQGRKTQTR